MITKTILLLVYNITHIAHTPIQIESTNKHKLTKTKNSKVISFDEKNQINEGWINGGYFVVNYEFINFLNKNPSLVLEKKPLILAAQKNQFNAYKHSGFWACMDTLRDKENLEYLLKQKKAPWIK